MSISQPADPSLTSDRGAGSGPSEGSLDLADALGAMMARGASDLLLKVGSSPRIRVNGRLERIDPDAPSLEPWETEHVLHEMLPDSKMREFEDRHEIDFAYSVPGVSRFRVAAYKQRGSVSIALRVVPSATQSFDELGLPEVIRRLAEEERGVILVTGTTSSGKSTTLSAMIEHLNHTSPKHVVTIEDPIEYLHGDAESVIDQREVGDDTESFQTALKHVLRQDPDVILIGEMRDEETVRTALAAAETGHLVLSTLHTLDASETINRIIDFFAPHEHEHVRAMLAGTLRGIISQRLVPRADGAGRVPICEILIMTGRVHDAILDPDRSATLRDIIAEGTYYGMQSFDQALYAAVVSGAVDMTDALHYAARPHDFKLLVAAEGQTSTSMPDEDIATGPGPLGSEPSVPAPDASAPNGKSHFEPSPPTPLPGIGGVSVGPPLLETTTA